MRLAFVAALASILLGGCMVPGNRYFAEPIPPGKAAIYVYRQHPDFAVSGYPNVYVDERLSHTLRNNTYGVSFVEPGRHQVKVSGSLLGADNWTIPNSTIAVDAKAGQTIFVRYTPEPKGQSTLMQIVENEAVPALVHTRLAD